MKTTIQEIVRWVTTTNAKEWHILEDTRDRKLNDKKVIERTTDIECKSRIW